MVYIRSYLKSILIHKCLIFMYVSKDVRIRGYFSKPKWAVNKNIW
jgi:hypothetical protein